MDSSEIVTLVVAVLLVAVALWSFAFSTRMVRQSKELLDLVRELRARTEDTLKQIDAARPRWSGNRLEGAGLDLRPGNWGHPERLWDREGAEVSDLAVGTATRAVDLLAREDLASLPEDQRKELRELAFNAAKSALGAPFTWIMHPDPTEQKEA